MLVVLTNCWQQQHATTLPLWTFIKFGSDLGSKFEAPAKTMLVRQQRLRAAVIRLREGPDRSPAGSAHTPSEEIPHVLRNHVQVPTRYNFPPNITFFIYTQRIDHTHTYIHIFVHTYVCILIRIYTCCLVEGSIHLTHSFQKTSIKENTQKPKFVP